MTMTDPIADMLTRIRNGNLAFHDEVPMPASKLKVELAKILEGEGFIEGYDVVVEEGRPSDRLVIKLKYTNDRKRTITGIKRISKPGLRVYKRANEVGRVLNGMGIAVLSTNEGLMTDREARRRHVGGEILCHVW